MEDFKAPQYPPPGYEEMVGTRWNQQPPLGRDPPSQQSRSVFGHAGGRGRPIAIPATTAEIGSPFLRAYPPSLQIYNISREQFLQFIDDLNRVTVKSPPLQVLGLASNIVGFVPLATAQIVGAAVNAATTIGTVAVSKGRGELLLREANRDIFGPVGLKVELAKLEALAKLAGMPILMADGKIDKAAPLLEPIENPHDAMGFSGQQRRLQAIEPWIAPLELHSLPEIRQHTNPLSTLSQKASESARKRGEKKMLKKRIEAHEEYHKEMSKAKEDLDKEMRKIDKDEAKARREKSADKVQKELAKVEKKRAKALREYHKTVSEAGEDRMSDDEEEKSVKKVLWILVRPLDATSGSGQNPDLPA